MADTPHTLRMKAAEFRRLALSARDPGTVEDLRRLADDYTTRAAEIESGSALTTASNENAAHHAQRTG